MMGATTVNDVGYYRQGAGGQLVRNGEGAGRTPMGYYTSTAGRREPDGHWSVIGVDPEKLGLEDGAVVDPDVMEGLYGDAVAPSGLPLGQAHGKYTKKRDALLERYIEREGGAEAILPERMEVLRRMAARNSQKAVLGWDLTFGVAKSYTVAHAACDWAAARADRMGDSARADEFRSIRDGIESAILEANEAALKYASKVMLTRFGKHGATGHAEKWVEAPGMITASFLQHTNRDEGAHLHVHNVVANRVRSADGEWRAIDGKSLKEDRWAISAVADRVLDEKITALGIDVALRRDGMAREIAAVPEATRDLFSSRSKTIRGEKLTAAIAAEEERYGRTLTALEVDGIKRRLTLATRKGKVKDGEGETWDELRDRWNAEHEATVGASLGPIADRIRRQVAAGPKDAAGTFSADAVIKEAVDRCAAVETTWTRGRLRHEINLLLPSLGGMAANDVEEFLDELVDRALASSGLAVEVAGRDDDPIPASLRDKGVYYSSPAKRLYASSSTLLAEDVIRRAAVTRGRFALDHAKVDEWLATYNRRLGQDRELGEDQASTVRGVATSDAALTVVVGPPGAGKSTTLGAFSGCWHDLSGGGKVHGLAVSSKAAEVLEEDGLLSSNVARWLARQERLAAGKGTPEDAMYRMSGRDVVVVDESSMIETALLSRVREVVERHGARLVLTGDPKQLASVGAGGAMSLVDGHAETYVLTGIRRFVEAWERDATIALRAGDKSVIAEYDRHGRIRETETLSEALSAAARAAVADRIEGRSAVVLTGSNEDASTVASQIRDALVAAGVVPDGPTVELEHHGGVAGVDDEVMCRKNDHANGVLNRGAYRVTEVEESGGMTVANPKTGELFRLSPAYVQRHVSSAYASTIAAAQGITVDTSHIVTDGRLDRNGLLVALTRGRMRNTAYVSRREDERDQASAAKKTVNENLEVGVRVDRDTERPDAVTILEDVLDRDGEAIAATVERERDEARLASAETLLGRIEEAVELSTSVRFAHDLDRMVEEGLLSSKSREAFRTDQSTAHVSKLMRAIEQGGGDRLEVLREALDRRAASGQRLGFSGARSVAQVLSTRIQEVRTPGEPLAERAVPADLPEPERRYIERQHEKLADRQASLGSEVAEEAPAWAVRAFGPVPEEPVERLSWERRVGVVAAYREATGWDDESRPMGRLDEAKEVEADRPIPDAPGITSTERRLMWHEAYDTLGRPEYGRDEATMTEGQLRTRVRAWEREQEWAPAYADKSQKAAELDADSARQDAAFVDGQEREAALGRARDRAGVGDVMNRTGEARRAWAVETATMRAAGERAREELKYRGVEVGHEPDRMTPEEWLAKAREDRTVDEAHRVVTEVDLADDVRAEAHAEGVEERAGDLAHVEAVVPRQSRSAHREAPITPSAVELEALSAEASATFDVIADRVSAEESARDAVEELTEYDVSEVEERSSLARERADVARYA
jgi:hypothetical protein